MGLFKQKKKKTSVVDEAVERAERIFDESFRNELRTHGRMYFERTIKESAVLFRQDLDATIIQVYTELKQHVTAQLDEQFFKYSQSMKDAQDTALQSLNRSVNDLKEQHQLLSIALKKEVADQRTAIMAVFEDNNNEIKASKEAQANALEILTNSVKALQEQQQKMSEVLAKNLADQEATMIAAFESNMAQVVEHYLLGALGDQYDLKSQLPSIIKQMEANKQAMMDDIKL